MLDIIFILLTFLAIVLMIYSISERAIAFLLMDSILWLILGALLLQGVEVPYEMFNSTSGNIETGVHTITTNLDPLSYLLQGIAVIMFLLFIIFIVEDYLENRRR